MLLAGKETRKGSRWNPKELLQSVNFWRLIVRLNVSVFLALLLVKLCTPFQIILVSKRLCCSFSGPDGEMVSLGDGLFTAIRRNKKLKITFAHKRLGPKVLEEIGYLLKSNSLCGLDMTQCNMRSCIGHDAEVIFLEGLTHNRSLKSFRFSPRTMSRWLLTKIITKLPRCLWRMKQLSTLDFNIM